MWARAFRDKDYHAAINTNNGTESLNKVLKYNYLPRKKNITLSSMCAILIESFLPDAHQKYVCLNCMQSSQYRSYKSHVPDYLRDRPRSTVVHCLERKSKALKYGKEDIEVLDDKQGIFSVKDKTHRVRFGIESDDGMPSCTCTDWQQWHIPCKHFFAIFNLQSGLTWNRFHSKYLQSPYLSTDTLSLACYFDNSTSHEASTVQQGQDNSTDFPSTTDQGTDQKESELPKRKVSQHVHVYYVHLYMQIMCLLSNHVNYLYSLSSLPPSLPLPLPLSTDIYDVTKATWRTCQNELKGPRDTHLYLHKPRSA